jgi:integrase
MLVRVPAPRYKVGKGLSVDEVKRLLKAAEGHRLHPLYLVAATMGLRRGELLGLRWVDLDLDRGTWRPDKTAQRVGGKLRLQDTKTEDSDGVLPLPEVTWLTLSTTRSDRRPSAPASATGGRITGSCSRPRSARLWSRATSTVTSTVSGDAPGCRMSGYMIFGTRW